MRSTALFFVAGLVASAAAGLADAPTLGDLAILPRSDSRPVRKHHRPRSDAPHSARAVADADSTPAVGRRQRRALRDAIARQHNPRASLDIVALIGRLQNVCSIMKLHQANIHRSRNQLKTSPKVGKTSNYRQQVTAELAAFRRASGGSTPVVNELTAAFAHFGRGKGTAYLDKHNQLEVLLKDLVNSIKYTLSDINYIVYKLPILGPVLGPVVYDIKCLIDTLLNGIENTADSLLNCVAPQLTSLTAELGISLANFGMPLNVPLLSS